MEDIRLDRSEREMVTRLLDFAYTLSEGSDICASISRVRGLLDVENTAECAENVNKSGEIVDNIGEVCKTRDETSDGAITKNDATIVRYAINVYEMVRRGRYESLKEKYGIDIMDDIDKKWIQKAEEIIPDELYSSGYVKRLSKSLKGTKVPARKLYIADLHFFHDGLCRRMDNRPFKDHYEMNEAMIRIWNENVTDKDEVYILGDFSIAKAQSTNEVLRKLTGKKYLIIGNHDYYLEDKVFDTSLFEWIRPYAEIGDNGRKVVLSHYPILCYNGQYRKKPDGTAITYMLYGHVHNTHDEVLVNKFIQTTRNTEVLSKGLEKPEPIPCNMINCFCMFSNYVPLTLDEWIIVDAERRAQMNVE